MMWWVVLSTKSSRNITLLGRGFRNSFRIRVVLYWLYMDPGFYSYTEGAIWKILDLLTETLLIYPSITVSRSFGCFHRRRLHRQTPLAS